jgi:hypothetical protein
MGRLSILSPAQDTASNIVSLDAASAAAGSSERSTMVVVTTMANALGMF